MVDYFCLISILRGAAITCPVYWIHTRSGKVFLSGYLLRFGLILGFIVKFLTNIDLFERYPCYSHRAAENIRATILYLLLFLLSWIFLKSLDRYDLMNMLKREIAFLIVMLNINALIAAFHLWLIAHTDFFLGLILRRLSVFWPFARSICTGHSATKLEQFLWHGLINELLPTCTFKRFLPNLLL